jgi:hypothetical protein
MHVGLGLLFCLLVVQVSLALPQDEMVMTPSGLRPRECVYAVPSGAHILRTPNGHHVYHPNGTFQIIPKCPIQINQVARGQQGNGWQVFAFYNATKKATVFDGVWNVPGQPQNPQSQLLYLFTGMVNVWTPVDEDFTPDQTEDIIQPVLQWGVGPAGGGSYWSMASWYVADVAIHSELKKTAFGHSIYGTMHKTGANTWKIISMDKNTAVSTDLNVQRDNTYVEPWAFVTLEVYKVQACNAYPVDPVNFNNLLIQSGSTKETPRWKASAYQKICNEAVKIKSPSEVQITW